MPTAEHRPWSSGAARAVSGPVGASAPQGADADVREGGPPPLVVSTGDFLPQRRRDAESRWYVLHTRSRQEKALDSSLRGLGLSCYLPVHRSTRRYGQRVVEATLPLFPGYVFLWGTRDETFVADRTRRVAHVLHVLDQPTIEWELANVSRALASGVRLDPHAAIREGVRVRVVSGPFEGVEGVVTSRTTAERLVLQVRMLNTAASLDIHDALVEPVDA